MSTPWWNRTIVGNRLKVWQGGVLWGGLMITATAWNSFFVVKQGQQGVLIDIGKGPLSEEYKEGLHFCIPFLQQPLKFNMRPQQMSVTVLTTETADNQSYDVSAHLDYQLDGPSIHKVLMKVGPRMDIIVPGIVETKIKKELKEITSVHLREHTKEISQNISNQIRGELESRSAIVLLNDPIMEYNRLSEAEYERRLKMNPKRF